MKHLIKKLLREGLLNENNTCDVFTDVDTNGHFAGAIKHDLYYFVEKQVKVHKEFISPDEYFNRLHNNDIEDVKRTMSEIIDWDDVKEKTKKMKSGIKFDVPWITRHYNREKYTGDHEGRHRTLAAKEFGCEKIPVLIVEYIPDSAIQQFANDVGDLDVPEMRDKLKEMGFKNLEFFNVVFRTLKRFREKYKKDEEEKRKKEEEKIKKIETRRREILDKYKERVDSLEILKYHDDISYYNDEMKSPQRTAINGYYYLFSSIDFDDDLITLNHLYTFFKGVIWNDKSEFNEWVNNNKTNDDFDLLFYYINKNEKKT